MAIDALSVLLGPQAGAILSAAVGEHGSALHAVRARSVHVRPTGAAVVRYAAALTHSDGRCGTDTLVAATGDRIPHGATVVAGEHRGEPVQIGIWRFPHDPALPALATAADPRRICAELRRHGLTTATSVTVALRAYRPGRRAVIEVSSPDGQRWFVKVVRPAALDGMLERHRLMSPHTPVMPVLGHTATGAVILPVAPGCPVRTLIAAGAQPPSVEALEHLLDGLPPAVAALPQRVSPLAQVSDFAAVIALTGNDELRCAAASLAQDLQDVDVGESVPVAVHGDFHEGQLLADGGTITGLLDVDTAGAGQRVDEWATLIGHLAVSRNEPAQQYCAAVREHAERRTDAVRLRARVSAVLLGLATGPFRVQHPHWPTQTAARLALARRWLTG